MNFNQVILMGYLAQDVELKQGPNTPYVDLSIAINNGNQESQKSVDYIKCRAFGRNAENISKYFYQGRPIFVTGRLEQNKWTDKDGKKCSSIRVSISKFEFVDSKKSKTDPIEIKEHEVFSPVASINPNDVNDEPDFDSL